MKTLISVLSFEGESFNHQNIREGWGSVVPQTGADLKFFVGRRGKDFSPQSDEVPIGWQYFKNCEHSIWNPKEGCCENYFQYQTRRILEWTLKNGYDFIFLAENDTFLLPRKLMQTGFEDYDYSGYFFQGDEKYPCPHPGFGYFLSANAMKLVLQTPPDHRGLGFFVGYALGPNLEASLFEIPNFREQISWHYPDMTGKRYPVGGLRWQKDMFKQYER
jgi:hypothetical protein